MRVQSIVHCDGTPRGPRRDLETVASRRHCTQWLRWERTPKPCPHRPLDADVFWDRPDLPAAVTLPKTVFFPGRMKVWTDRDPPSVWGRFEAAVSPARIKDGFVGSERRSTA